MLSPLKVFTLYLDELGARYFTIRQHPNMTNKFRRYKTTDQVHAYIVHHDVTPDRYRVRPTCDWMFDDTRVLCADTRPPEESGGNVYTTKIVWLEPLE